MGNDSISAITGIGLNGNRVEPVRNYTAKELEAKRKQMEIEYYHHQEFLEYAKNFKNPENLSFAELLERAIAGKTEEEQEVIVDIDFKRIRNESGSNI